MAPIPVHDELHRIAVTGIIWKLDERGERRYLITKRSPHKKVFPNKWTVPGGGLEVSDYINDEPSFLNEESPQWYNTAEKTLRREIREEVGLEVEGVQYLLDVTFVRPDGSPVMVLSYYCKYKSGEIVLDEDTVEYAWVRADEVQNYDLIQGIDHEILEVDKRLSK